LSGQGRDDGDIRSHIDDLAGILVLQCHGSVQGSGSAD